MNKIILLILSVTMGFAGAIAYQNSIKPDVRIQQVERDIKETNRKLILAVGDISQLGQNFGAISIPSAPYLFVTTLQSGIGTSDTSMTLNLGTIKDGTSLTGYNCFSIDTGTVSAEYTCGTASGTAISSLVRGINPLNPAATSSALTFSHRRGADVRITDFPILQVIKRLVDGTDSFPSRISLDSSIATSTFTTYNFINKQYADGLALQGAPTATGTTPGIVSLSTRTQLSNGTAQSGAYTLMPQNAYFNSLTQSATTVPVTLGNGKLSQGFLDLTQAWIFTGTTTFATTTFVLAPTAPTSTPAGDTSLITKYYADRVVVPKFGLVTRAGDAATSTQAITHGLGRTPKFIRLVAVQAFSSGVSVNAEGIYDGSTIAGIWSSNTNDTNNTSGNSSTYILTIKEGASAIQQATTTVDSTNINLGWTLSGSGFNSSNINILWEAY